MDYIKSRDCLSANPKVAREYERLKARLAAKYYDNREVYTKGKEMFIQKIMESIR